MSDSSKKLPSEYTVPLPELTTEYIAKILTQLHDNLPLSQILPTAQHRQRFFNYLADNPSVAARYDQAQRSRAELYVEDIVDIADSELDSNRARVRIDARRWYASKMQPQKYGDKLELNVNNSVDISTALAETKRRLRPVRDQHDIEDAQIVEPKQLKDKRSTDKQSVDPPQKTLSDQKNPVEDPFE